MPKGKGGLSRKRRPEGMKRYNFVFTQKVQEDIDALMRSLDAGSMSEAMRRGLRRARQLSDYIDLGYKITATKDGEVVKIDFS